MIDLRNPWLQHRRLSLIGLVRVAALFAAIGAVTLILSVRQAAANAEGEARKLGKQLLENFGTLVLDEAVPVRVNGSNLFMSATATDLAPNAVVDRFETYCREHSGFGADAPLELARLTAGRALPAEVRDPARWGSARSAKSNEDFAQMLCFMRRDKTNVAGQLRNLMAFVRDGDLSHFGEMHYLVARRLGPNRTQVLVTWSQGSVNVRSMFPAEGDAPGGDLDFVARPPDSTRVLSAQLEGRPYSVHMYETHQPPERALRHYDKEFEIHGMKPDPVWLERVDDAAATPTPSYARAFTLPRGLLLVTAVEALDDSGITQVSLIEMGSNGDAKFAAN
jgi:hypothetical protein